MTERTTMHCRQLLTYVNTSHRKAKVEFNQQQLN